MIEARREATDCARVHLGAEARTIHRDALVLAVRHEAGFDATDVGRDVGLARLCP
jgi:hypothetical protein